MGGQKTIACLSGKGHGKNGLREVFFFKRQTLLIIFFFFNRPTVEEASMNWIGRQNVTELQESLNWMKFIIHLSKGGATLQVS